MKIYPNYNDGEDTTSKVRAFQFVLRDSVTEKYLAEDVELFFQEWMRTEKKLPMPADALGFCRRKNAHRKAMQSPMPQQRVIAHKAKRVPWYGMEYSQILNSEHKLDFDKHMEALRRDHGDRRANDYILYLKNHNIAK